MVRGEEKVEELFGVVCKSKTILSGCGQFFNCIAKKHRSQELRPSLTEGAETLFAFLCPEHHAPRPFGVGPARGDLDDSGRCGKKQKKFYKKICADSQIFTQIRFKHAGCCRPPVVAGHPGISCISLIIIR